MIFFRTMHYTIFIIAFFLFMIPIYVITSSMVVAISIALFISLPIALIKNKFDWTAFMAFTTLVALLFAIYHQELKSIINKPTLQYSFFESSHPHLIEQIGTAIKRVDGRVAPISYKGYFLTLQLINNGKIIARNAEVLLTNVWYKDANGDWRSKKTGWPFLLNGHPPCLNHQVQ